MGFTTPRTWSTSEMVTAAMMNEQIRDNTNAAFPLGVDAWTSYTPTLTQSGAVTKTVTYAKYQRVGRMITAQAYLDVTGSGTAANVVTVSLPVTAASSASLIVGVGQIFDASANALYRATMRLLTTTTLIFHGTTTTTNGGLGTTDFTAALASSDVVMCTVSYEAAS